MSYVVYGLRLQGSLEARYIGQTYYTARDRLANHRSESIQTDLANWVRAHRDTVETFDIAKVETRQEARRIERESVRICLALNHRLFNRQLVPADQRLNSFPASTSDTAAAA